MIKGLKEALSQFKDEVLGKMKEQGEASSEQMTALEKRIDEKIAEMVKAQENGSRKISMPGLEEEAEKFHLSKVIEMQLTGKWGEDSDFEKAIVEEIMKTTNAGTLAAGGALIPDEVTNEIIEMAIAQTPIESLGVTKMTGLRGELPIPKVTGRPTAYWVGEEEAATESSSTFGEITLRPKTLAAFTKISRRVLHQSSGLAERIVREELTNSMSLALEQALINGAGSSKEPKGIVNYSGLTTTAAIGTNGGRFKVDKATDMVTNIDVANLLKPGGKYGFLVRPEAKQGLATERVVQYSGQSAEDGMPVINPFMTEAQIESMLGYPLKTTTLIPATLTKGTSSTCSYAIFGNWAQVILGSWEGFELKASDVAGNSSGSAMLNRQIWLSAFQGVDIQMKNEAAMTVLSDVENTKADW